MKDDPIIISHIYNDGEWHIQSNDEHCKGVAELAAEFASDFGMAEWGRLLGLLHDRGKESNGFQAYIRRETNYDPKAYSPDSKKHSDIGAVLAHRLPFDRDYWLSNVIAGHHRGLYDFHHLEARISKDIPKEVSQNIPDIQLTHPTFLYNPTEESHICRMLFSCLIDADRLDTERFKYPHIATMRGDFPTLNELEMKLQKYRETLKVLPSSPINQIRNEIQEKCEQAASLAPGFFDLTVPTGGGKTLASVIWAIRHAVIFNKKRIIIAIPFTSIIVQTAAILKDIFGVENVIEHHNAVDFDSKTKDAEVKRWSLACENWDAPIIVTTNVQLFESMFSNHPFACRKLHSIANSVVILDEIQSLSRDFLQPIVNSIKSYSKIFGTSFLFCTASQPILDGMVKGCSKETFKGIDRNSIRSISSEDMNLQEKLRRVKISVAKGPAHTYQSLANLLKNHKRVLCIVNTRTEALKLYEELSQYDLKHTYHLSKSMCAAHLHEKINEITNKLADPDTCIRVVSTPLLEAGVDIDFPLVYRQLSGLDSILQAAGRCNRNGKLEIGSTIVFSLENSEATHPIEIRNATEVMSDILELDPNIDWFAPDIMRLYFKKLYSRTPSFDREKIIEKLSSSRKSEFETVADKFQLIDTPPSTIIVNYEKAQDLIEELKKDGPTRILYRKLGRFCVDISKKVFDKFRKNGVIEEIYPNFFFSPQTSDYDENVGFKTRI